MNNGRSPGLSVVPPSHPPTANSGILKKHNPEKLRDRLTVAGTASVLHRIPF